MHADPLAPTGECPSLYMEFDDVGNGTYGAGDGCMEHEDGREGILWRIARDRAGLRDIA